MHHYYFLAFIQRVINLCSKADVSKRPCQSFPGRFLTDRTLNFNSRKSKQHHHDDEDSDGERASKKKKKKYRKNEVNIFLSKEVFKDLLNQQFPTFCLGVRKLKRLGTAVLNEVTQILTP